MEYYYGVDLGGTNLAVGIVDQNGNILAKKSIATDKMHSVAGISEDIKTLAEELTHKLRLELSDIRFCGIGMPSCVNPKTGLLVFANNLGWKNIPIYDAFRNLFPFPIAIENDANCAVWGESITGAASGCKNVVMLTLGTGVGGGIILDGKIYKGADSMGVELGHTKIVYNGIECSCGQRGCLEMYASATALISQTRDAIKENRSLLLSELFSSNPEGIDGRSAFIAAKQNDTGACQIVRNYLSYLACGISNFITIFRPEKIILGGGIANEGEALFVPLREIVYNETFAANEIGIPEIIPAVLGNDAGIIGAALLQKQYQCC